MTGPFYDIQIAELLLDETRKTFSLNSLADTYLGLSKSDDQLIDWVTNNLNKKRDHHSFIWRVPSDIIEGYAKDDALLALKIFQKQEQQLREKNLWDLFLLETNLLPQKVVSYKLLIS